MIKFRSLLIFCSFLFMLFAEIAFMFRLWKLKEREFARSLVSAGALHCQKAEEMYESLSMLRHDFKYHLKVINELQQTGYAKEIRQYAEDVKKHIPEDCLHYYCSNSVINALLSGYAENCKELNINYNVKIALPKILSIQIYDLCIILGNLLENALEACKKLGGGEIKLFIKTGGSHLSIMVKNTFDGTVSKIGGKLASAKKNGGFGLPSIKAVIDSYGGRMLTEWNEREFTVYVMV